MAGRKLCLSLLEQQERQQKLLSVVSTFFFCGQLRTKRYRYTIAAVAVTVAVAPIHSMRPAGSRFTPDAPVRLAKLTALHIFKQA